MYPQLQVLGFTVHTFGLALAGALATFFWAVRRASSRSLSVQEFVLGEAWWFLLAAAVSSRAAFFLQEWRDYRFLLRDGTWFQALFMSDYNLSLAGAVAGFGAMAWWRSLRLRRKERRSVLDAYVLGFLAAAPIGYLGALLGGQVFGLSVPAESAWGIRYTHAATAVPGELPRFPLALAYAAAAFISFCAAWLPRPLRKIPGASGALGMALFGAAAFAGEFFSGSQDIVGSYLWLNLNQFCSLAAIFLGLKALLQSPAADEASPESAAPSK